MTTGPKRRTRIQKWGNSLALRIPRSLALEAGLERDAPVDVSLAGGRLVVEPAMTLDALLALVTPDNMHGEVETGSALGREAW